MIMLEAVIMRNTLKLEDFVNLQVEQVLTVLGTKKEKIIVMFNQTNNF